MTSRRQFLASTAAIASAGRTAWGKARQPNVLVIIADEWRAQPTSWNGDRNVSTPALDHFARESVCFDNAVSNLPVCCPARASIMTGQFPLTHGVFINDVELKPKGATLGQTFRDAGYRTGYIGKWHLYGSPDGNYGRRRRGPKPPGFRAVITPIWRRSIRASSASFVLSKKRGLRTIRSSCSCPITAI